MRLRLRGNPRAGGAGPGTVRRTPAAALLAGLVLLWVAALPARADSLASRLNSAWEVLWDERGSPQRAFRWREGAVLRYHVHGRGADEHREHIAQALALAAQHTGLQIRAAATRPEPSEGPLLEIEFVPDGQLETHVACATSVLKAGAWHYEHVRIQMRGRMAWHCTHHEVLHAMGLRGHPSGSTILNYLHARRDTFTPLDVALLRAWYAPTLKPGYTLLESFQAMRDHLVQAEPAADQPRARATAEQLTRERLQEFEALARGEGEVPAIVKRAGRASAEHMGLAVREAAYTLGLAYLRGTLVPRDEPQSAAWMRRAADAGHVPGQVMLARALRDGQGLPRDRVAAHEWLSRAARAGNEVARKELAALEAALAPGELASARARSTPPESALPDSTADSRPRPLP